MSTNFFTLDPIGSLQTLSYLRDALHYAILHRCTDFIESTSAETAWLRLSLKGIAEPRHLSGLQPEEPMETEEIVHRLLKLAQPNLPPHLYESLLREEKGGPLLALITQETISVAYREAWAKHSFSGPSLLELNQPFYERLLSNANVKYVRPVLPGLLEIGANFPDEETAYRELRIRRRERSFVDIVRPVGLCKA
jgi:hypothetical protein